MKRRVRTTIQPWRVIEVEGPEYMDLLRQGLVLRSEEEGETEAPPAEPEAPVVPSVPAPVTPSPQVTDDRQESAVAPESPAAVSAEAASSKARSAARRAGTRN